MIKVSKGIKKLTKRGYQDRCLKLYDQLLNEADNFSSEDDLEQIKAFKKEFIKKTQAMIQEGDMRDSKFSLPP